MVNRNLEQAVVKTVVAFLNTVGGVLVIGVDDDKTIRGLQSDYDSFSKKNRDGFQLHLQQILSQAIGVDRHPSHTLVEFRKLQDKEVCLVRVKPASKPVVIKEQNQPILYVRAGGASKTLNVEEALRYVQDHWGGYI
jgi:predicted HTH transcriptional regulator